jgi:F0F1-type ATP synthase assembly protein I
MGTTDRSAFLVIGVQGSAIAASALMMTIWGWPSGVSMVMGGFSILLPNAIFAWASTRRRSGGWLLVQGVVKFLLSVVMMAIAFRHFSPEPLAFFAGVIVALVAHAIGGFWLQSQTLYQASPDRAKSAEQ